MKRALILYVPILHAGYIGLFEKYRGNVDTLYIFGEDIVSDFFSFKKEIRALDAAITKKLIEALGIFSTVAVLHKENPPTLKDIEIITAEDSICRAIIEHHFPNNNAIYEPVFLRWDSKNVKSSSDVAYDRTSDKPFDRAMCDAAANEAEKSSDWWRHVGAVVVRDGKLIFKNYNHHIPSDHTPYANGDPRDSIEPGTLNLVYSSLHAEQSIIADAAKLGVALEGTDMYLNVFPCPLCAKLMAAAGIKKCFFKTGSAWLDAESVLRASGIEIILVN